MFLANPSPSVALPRTLEPSSHPRGSRYPVSSSEPEGDLARATVSTEAQRVTSSNLPSEEASLGRSRAYGHLLQEESKARGRKPRGGPQTLQGRMAGSNGLEVEEGSEYDSDDSVDREIEEAIQEYLRGKGPDGQPLAEREADEKVVQEERSAHDPAGSTFHADVGAAEIQQERASEDPESKGAKWPLPPSSLSSTSYFGQNAPAETEEFSSERKEQARKRRRRRGRRDNPWDGKEARDTPALGSQEEETRPENHRREDPVAPFSRWNPELQGPQGSECGESRSNEELADSRKTSKAPPGTPLAGPSLGRSRGGEKRQEPREARVGNHTLSDLSSDDDSIEKEIQRYQLEKIGREAVTERCLSARNRERQAGGAGEISVSPAVPWAESALPAFGREPQKMNRKVELSQKAGRCQELQKGRNRAPPENSTVTSQVFSQAGPSAEKVCAEATLDISKFILSSPTGSDHRLFGTDHALGPQASQQERDSDAVDSDNSIDQEIRACLAIQAQRERSAAEPREVPCSARDPPTSSQLPMQARSLKRMSPKPLKLPLSPKRRRKGENRLSTPGPDGQPRQAETDWSYVDDAHSGTSASWPGKESPAPGASWYQEDPEATASSINVANPFSWGQLGTRNHAKKTTRNVQKYGPGDESSSLDSDEDLDTVIKELLRSKQKQKEKNEDQRIQWMKQVRSGDMERMPVLEGKGGGACRPEAACLLKGCPVRSGRELNGGSAAKQSQSMAERKLKDDRAVPVAYAFDNPVEPSSLPEVWDFSKYPQSSWAAGSFPDDSIERGIRSFGAEKAKGSASSMEASGAHAIPETQEADKLWTYQMKARFSQLWKGQDGTPSQKKGSVKKGSPPIVGLRGSPRSETKANEHASSPDGNHTVTSTEEAWSYAMVPLQRQQGPLFAPDVGVPARSTAAESRGLCLSELVQRDFPGEGVAQHHRTAQSRLPPLCPLRRQPVCEFSNSSCFMAGLESAPSEKRAVLWGKRQGVDAVSFTRQGRGAAPELCWKRRGARAEEAEFAPSFGAEGLPACISERSVRGKVPPLCPERLNRAKGCPWAVEGADNPVNSNPGSPSEEPPADVRGVGIHTGVLKLEIPNEEERGKSQGCLVSGREGKVTYIPLDMLLREESGFDQGKAAAHQAPRALEESSGIYRQA